MTQPHTHRTGNSPRSNVLLFASVLLVLLVGVPMTAHAEFVLGTAKKAGQVGEKRDGYIALIDQRAPEQVKQVVEATNERRQQRYREIAAKVGWTVEEAAKAAAKRHFKHALAGELLEREDGGWEKKVGGPKRGKGPRRQR